jgi:CheY-like chemotaxis protein/two-component sensor histidine kinase
MLRARILDEERTEKAFEVIERNTRQQSSLIEDLLDVSRIISGKMRIEKQLVDVSAIVHDAAETMRPIAAAAEVRFTAAEAPEPIFIDGDPVRLRQVFTNLLQNAIKFTPAGGAVTADIRGRENGFVVTVRDTGVGIEKDFLPHIFDRFSQADASTRRAFAGLGLGLTIVKTIVDLHGGKIRVDSEGPNRGAAFTVELPFARKILRDERSLVGDADTNSRSELAGMKVLLVDDDAESLDPLQTFLSHEGAVVAVANNADDALEMLEAADFDLLVSDIGMPGKDGYEMMRALRASSFRNKNTPAIALTAYASNDDRDRAIDSGYQAHLPKPLDFDGLFREIKALRNEKPKKAD